jgi:hypothetical protein
MLMPSHTHTRKGVGKDLEPLASAALSSLAVNLLLEARPVDGGRHKSVCYEATRSGSDLKHALLSSMKVCHGLT